MGPKRIQLDTKHAEPRSSKGLEVVDLTRRKADASQSDVEEMEVMTDDTDSDVVEIVDAYDSDKEDEEVKNLVEENQTLDVPRAKNSNTSSRNSSSNPPPRKAQKTSSSSSSSSSARYNAQKALQDFVASESEEEEESSSSDSKPRKSKRRKAVSSSSSAPLRTRVNRQAARHAKKQMRNYIEDDEEEESDDAHSSSSSSGNSGSDDEEKEEERTSRSRRGNTMEKKRRAVDKAELRRADSEEADEEEDADASGSDDPGPPEETGGTDASGEDEAHGISIRTMSDSESEEDDDEQVTTWKHLTTQEQVSEARELGIKNLCRHVARIRPFVTAKVNRMLKDLHRGMSLADHKAVRRSVGRGRKNDGDSDEDEEEGQKEAEEEEPVEILRQPPTLSPECTMRKYQLEGLSWLVSQQEKGINSILGDEMGLGKTLQSISFVTYMLQVEKQTGPFLVIVPLSVLSNWMNEFYKWSPSLKVMRAHSTNLSEITRIVQTMKNAKKVQVIVTTYDMVKSAKMQRAFSSIIYNSIILDEGHRLKNAESGFAKSCGRLRARFKLILTGTPVQNNLGESWALLNFLAPDIFTDSSVFDAAFDLNSSKITIDRDMLKKSHYLLRPFILRRIKAEVESSLPPKLETMISCPMTDVQKRWTKSLLFKNKDELQYFDTGAVKGDFGRGKKLNFLLQQLRKAANHPYLFDGCEPPSMDGLPTEEIVSYSGKMVLLDRLLTKLQATGHRVVIFSQYTRVLDIISDFLSYRGHTHLRLDGSTNRVMREVRIREYNAPKSMYFIFCLTTRAGGEGVNLYTADTVILFDSDWNPQIDIQAMARVHRIGQTKTVHIYRLVTAGSVEERIVQRAQKKLFLDSMVNRGSSAQAKAMDEQLQHAQADPDAEVPEDESEVFTALKFGWNAIFSGEGGKDSTDTEKFFSEEDLDRIIDRTRGLDENGKLLSSAGKEKLGANGEKEAAEVDQDNVQVNIEEFDETTPLYDIRAIEGEIAKNVEVILTSKEKRLKREGINERNLESGPRTKRSRLIQEYNEELGMIDVLRVNNYSLEEGEPSVYEREAVEMKDKKAEAKKKAQLDNMFLANRGRQTAGRDYTHQDHCQMCWDGGSLVCCDYCPMSYHLTCLGIKEKDLPAKFSCPHHACAKCNRSNSMAGALFRCEQCYYAYCEDCLPKFGVHYTGESERLSKLGYRRSGSTCYIICSNSCRKHAVEMGEEDVGEDAEEEVEEEQRELGIRATSSNTNTNTNNANQAARLTYEQTVESIESCDLEDMVARIDLLKLTKTEARARFSSLQHLFGFALRWDNTSRAGKTVLRHSIEGIKQCFGLPFLSPTKDKPAAAPIAPVAAAVVAKVEEGKELDRKIGSEIADEGATVTTAADVEANTNAVVNEVSKDSEEADAFVKVNEKEEEKEELDPAVAKRIAAVEREAKRERAADEAVFTYQGVPLNGASDKPAGDKNKNRWDLRAYRAVIAVVRILSSTAKVTLLEVAFLLGVVLSKPIYPGISKALTQNEKEKRAYVPDTKYRVPTKESNVRRQHLEEIIAVFLVTLLPQNCILPNGADNNKQIRQWEGFTQKSYDFHSGARSLLNIARLCESNAFAATEIESNSHFFTGLSFLLEKSSVDLIDVKWKGTFEAFSADQFNDIMKPCRALYKGVKDTSPFSLRLLPTKLAELLKGKVSERQLRSLFGSAGKATWQDSGSEADTTEKRPKASGYDDSGSEDFAAQSSDTSSSDDEEAEIETDGKKPEKVKKVKRAEKVLVPPGKVAVPQGRKLRLNFAKMTHKFPKIPTEHVIEASADAEKTFTYLPTSVRQPHPVYHTPRHALVEFCAKMQYKQSNLDWSVQNRNIKSQWRNRFFLSWMTWDLGRRMQLERTLRENESGSQALARSAFKGELTLNEQDLGLSITLDMVNECFITFHKEQGAKLPEQMMEDEKDIVISHQWNVLSMTDKVNFIARTSSSQAIRPEEILNAGKFPPDPTHWKFYAQHPEYLPFLEAGQCPWSQGDVDNAYLMYCRAHYSISDQHCRLSQVLETSWKTCHKVMKQQFVLNFIRSRLGRWQGVSAEDLSMFPDLAPTNFHPTYEQVWGKSHQELILNLNQRKGGAIQKQTAQLVEQSHQQDPRAAIQTLQPNEQIMPVAPHMQMQRQREQEQKVALWQQQQIKKTIERLEHEQHVLSAQFRVTESEGEIIKHVFCFTPCCFAQLCGEDEARILIRPMLVSLNNVELLVPEYEAIPLSRKLPRIAPVAMTLESSGWRVQDSEEVRRFIKLVKEKPFLTPVEVRLRLPYLPPLNGTNADTVATEPHTTKSAEVAASANVSNAAAGSDASIDAGHAASHPVTYAASAAAHNYPIANETDIDAGIAGSAAANDYPIANETGISKDERAFTRKAVLQMCKSKITTICYPSDARIGVPCFRYQCVPQNTALVAYARSKGDIQLVLQHVEMALYRAAPNFKAYSKRSDIITRMLSTDLYRYFGLIGEDPSLPVVEEKEIHTLYLESVAEAAKKAHEERLAAEAAVKQREQIEKEAAEALARRPPERPLTAYKIFLGENMVREQNILKQAGLAATKPEATKTLRSNWIAMTSAEQAPYEVRALDLKDIYDKALAKHQAQYGGAEDGSSGEEELADVIICDGCEKEFFLDIVGLKAAPEGDWHCKRCALVKDASKGDGVAYMDELPTEAPKLKLRSGYLLFTEERRRKLKAEDRSKSHKDVERELSEMWKALTGAQKSAWNMQADLRNGHSLPNDTAVSASIVKVDLTSETSEEQGEGEEESSPKQAQGASSSSSTRALPTEAAAANVEVAPIESDAPTVVQPVTKLYAAPAAPAALEGKIINPFSIYMKDKSMHAQMQKKYGLGPASSWTRKMTPEEKLPYEKAVNFRAYTDATKGAASAAADTRTQRAGNSFSAAAPVSAPAPHPAPSATATATATSTQSLRNVRSDGEAIVIGSDDPNTKYYVMILSAFSSGDLTELPRGGYCVDQISAWIEEHLPEDMSTDAAKLGLESQLKSRFVAVDTNGAKYSKNIFSEGHPRWTATLKVNSEKPPATEIAPTDQV